MAEADDEFMDQSIRNEIPGTVKEIISDKVLSEIIVETESEGASAEDSGGYNFHRN